MRIKIIHTDLLSARKNRELMRTLYALTLRGYSEMRMSLQMAGEKAYKDHKIVLAKYKNQVIGWALCVPYCGYNSIDAYFANFYTGKMYRRLGVATRLYNACKKYDRPLYCSGWDYASTRFFNKVKTRMAA